MPFTHLVSFHCWFFIADFWGFVDITLKSQRVGALRPASLVLQLAQPQPLPAGQASVHCARGWYDGRSLTASHC